MAFSDEIYLAAIFLLKGSVPFRLRGFACSMCDGDDGHPRRGIFFGQDEHDLT